MHYLTSCIYRKVCLKWILWHLTFTGRGCSSPLAISLTVANACSQENVSMVTCCPEDTSISVVTPSDKFRCSICRSSWIATGNSCKLPNKKKMQKKNSKKDPIKSTKNRMCYLFPLIHSPNNCLAEQPFF